MVPVLTGPGLFVINNMSGLSATCFTEQGFALYQDSVKSSSLTMGLLSIQDGNPDIFLIPTTLHIL